MEGQLEAEVKNQDRMDHEKEAAEEEWKSWQRGHVRNTLHLVSAAAQWILLLACLIYLGIDSLQPSTPRNDKVPWTHIRYSGEIFGEVAINLTAEVGSMQIRNGSIIIPYDGLYLVSLRGKIHFTSPDLPKLTLLKTAEETKTPLWEQTVQDSGNSVNLTTVLFLFHQDNITLLTSSNATIKDLSFSLVLLRSTLNLLALEDDV